MFRRSALGLGLLVSAWMVAPAAAAEVEHPAFRSWARHPIGTTIAVRSVTESPASRLTTTTTTKLLEIKPDGAVLETQVTSDATGKLVTNQPDRLEQRKMFPVLPGVKPENIGKPSKALAQGEETLKIAGREFRTVWYDTKEKGDAGDTFTRTWLSDDAPGRLVKAVTRIPKASTTVTLELTRFDRP